ncbi:MAG: hypothetical protein RSC87_09660 [Muribaculaceae bacterium]
MIEEISKEIVLLLIDEYHLDIRDALRLLYTSDTYSKLTNLKSGLYTQSTPYIYEFLEQELTTGKLS